MAVRFDSGGKLVSVNPEKAREATLKIFRPKFKTDQTSSLSQSAILDAQKQREAQVAAQRAFQEAQRVKLESAREAAEFKKILEDRARIIARRGREVSKSSKDIKTGDRLRITEWTKNGNKVRRVENLDKGSITYNSFGPGRAGGGVRQIRGVTKSATPRVKELKIDLENLSPSQAIELGNMGITSKDLFDFGKRLKGIELVSTFTKREAENTINKIKSGKKTTAKDRAILLGLQFAIPSQQLILSLKQLPSYVKTIVDNPKNLVNLPGQVVEGLTQTGLEIVALARISPALAIARIGGELITFKAVGAGFKVVGKVGGAAAKRISPLLSPVRNGGLILKTSSKRGINKIIVTTKTGARKITSKSRTLRKIKSNVKSSRAVRELEISKFKSSVEYSNQLKRAKKIRKAASKKGRTANIGNRDYIEAVEFIEDFADRLAKTKAEKFVEQFKKNGGKLGLGQKEQFVNTVRSYVKKTLNEYPAYKKLKQYSRYTEPYQLKLIKTKRISTAKKLFSNIKSKISKSKINRKMVSTIKRIKRVTSPKRIKKKISKSLSKKRAVREFRKTNRYRMDKARKIRKVSIEQLKKSQNINTARKFVDKLFNEIAVRQKIDLTSLQYRQFKNVVKKRISTAIRRNDKAQIKSFFDNAKRIIDDMNKPSKRPSVKVFEKGVKTKRIKTIKDFKPETPRGIYTEVRSGQQVLLQKTKQISKVKQVSKQLSKQKQEVYIIQSVSKQSINLAPLIRFAIFSLSASIVKSLSLQKSKQGFKSLSLQKSAQDIKVLQKLATAVGLKVNVAQSVAQAVNTKLKPIQKAKTKQIGRKKNIILKKPKTPSFKKKTLPKKQASYYVITKKRGKIVRLFPKKLRLRDARDYLAYSIDNNLTKSAWIVPFGESKQISTPPKNIQGYYSKISKKLRPYKIKYGKKKQIVNGYIEKRKYFQDTPGEKRQLKTTIKRAKRKITPKQRKILIARLKKARAAKRKK